MDLPSRMLDVGCWMLDCRFWILDFGFWNSAHPPERGLGLEAWGFRPWILRNNPRAEWRSQESALTQFPVPEFQLWISIGTRRSSAQSGQQISYPLDLISWDL